MAILTPQLSTNGATYNESMAETYSWVMINNDQNRALFAKAVYLVNPGDISGGGGGSSTVTTHIIPVSASSVGTIPISAKGWTISFLSGTGTMNTGNGSVALSAGFSDSDTSTLVNAISYSTDANSTLYVRYNT